MYDEHARLRSDIDATDREGARINARGLPVIGWGILLTAAPAQLAAVPWLGWLVLVLGITATAVAGIDALRNRGPRMAERPSE